MEIYKKIYQEPISFEETILKAEKLLKIIKLLKKRRNTE